jgi:hypothetical protein
MVERDFLSLCTLTVHCILYHIYVSYAIKTNEGNGGYAMEQQLLEYLKYGVWILFGSGVIFEISPIQINPISSILGWLGNKLNRDVKNDISLLKSDIKNVQTDLQDHVVESQRRNILDFADELRQGREKTKENYDYIIGLHDRYEKYVEANNLSNGQITLAFAYISSRYQECLEHNSFYTGK